ncbi:MAG: hypothetical protein K2P44_00175 [Lachnospiraceae bacterium]|nr:hypothetical protein [Lachnospiraceae bacterium]
MGRMGALLFGVVCIGLAGSLLVACNRKREVDENSVQQMPQFIESESATEDGTKELELIALAESQEEAEKIAELYGITLSSFANGVAVFTTDKDLQELKELGDINGYPTLSVNNNSYQLKEFTVETDTGK